MPKKESILVLCAHSDDHVIGAGGTLAKYAEEGKKVIVVIFSYGELSHPWLKRKHSVEMRVKEAQKASEVIGAKETIFFGLQERKFSEEIIKKDIADKLKRIIRKYRPSKILTHSIDDPHPDHKALNKFVLDLADKIKYRGHIYVFDIWNPSLRKRHLPKMVVDISETFQKKIEALKCFKSQRLAAIMPLGWSVYFKAIKDGWKNNCRYAEIFHKRR